MTSRWLLAGALALALAACTDPRQIVLSIDTTAGVPCDIDRIRVVATAAGTTTFEQSLRGARFPVNVTLFDDTPNGSVELEISGLKGDVEVMRASGPLQFSGRKAVEPVLLDRNNCMPDAPCELSEAMAGGAESPGSSRIACGANVTRYKATPGLDSRLVDACKLPAHGTVLKGGNGGPVRLVDLESKLLDSRFQFYGRPIHQIWVGKDGYLSFTQDSPDPSGTVVPGPFDGGIRRVDAPPPRQSAMVFWDTLSLRDTGVCYALVGEPGTQQIRVTWAHACRTEVCSNADDLNFTVTLEEASQQVFFAYGTMTAGNPDVARGLNATVGLVNDATGCPAESCVLETGLCKDDVTPCGYSQVFSNTLQTPGVPNMQFTPVVDPE